MAQRHRTNLRHGSRRDGEHGVIITLVAVVMLFVVGAMAALSIDVVTLYTARSEAQLAADSAALAGARVLANSGMTSFSTSVVGVAAQPLAITVATQVAASNLVGGRNLNAVGSCTATGEICVSVDLTKLANPVVTVQVQRTDLPTFFARIWGRTAISVRATATAEAYNPSNALLTSVTPGPPVSPTCVKPLLLPNYDPTGVPNSLIFNPTSGAIQTTTLLSGAPVPINLQTACTGATPCNAGDGLTAWQYYVGDPASFPTPLATSVVCPGCSGFNDFQLRIAGCVQPPIACNAFVSIDSATSDATRDVEAVTAVNDMTHSIANQGDSVDTLNAPSPPFQFLTGSDNPVVLSGAVNPNTPVMVSDSLVTVPVFDTTNFAANFPQVQLIGFVQLFLNPTGSASAGAIQTQVINLVGCGSASPGQAIIGNGSSPVVVRLISP